MGDEIKVVPGHIGYSPDYVAGDGTTACKVPFGVTTVSVTAKLRLRRFSDFADEVERAAKWEPDEGKRAEARRIAAALRKLDET